MILYNKFDFSKFRWFPSLGVLALVSFFFLHLFNILAILYLLYKVYILKFIFLWGSLFNFPLILVEVRLWRKWCHIKSCVCTPPWQHWQPTFVCFSLCFKFIASKVFTILIIQLNVSLLFTSTKNNQTS